MATVHVTADEVMSQFDSDEVRDEFMSERRMWRSLVDDARAAVLRGDNETAVRLLDDLLAKPRDWLDEHDKYKAAMQDKESARFVEAAS